MKKRLSFDFLVLLAIVTAFFVLFKFQDLDYSFLDKLKTVDKNTLVQKVYTENVAYTDLDEEENEVFLKEICDKSLETEFGNCFYYEALKEEEKVVYKEIFCILKDMKNNVELSVTDSYFVEKIFKCVMNDHPEFYYVEGYTYTTYTKKDTITKLEFSGTYTKSKEECEALNEQIDRYVTECFLGMPTGLSDYGKVKYLYEYIIDRTEYDLMAKESQNICSVFLQGKSVCMGYARAMQYLLLKENILCTIVNGTAEEGEEHAWNMVRLDGEYYHLDVTWGDASYTGENTGILGEGITNYSFFCVTTDEIEKTHTIGAFIPLPECTSRDNNYYIKEGYFFNAADKEKLSTVFNEAYESEKGYVEIKCENEAVYEEIFKYLIEDRHIFDYMKEGNDSVSYYDGKELLLLEIWLK